MSINQESLLVSLTENVAAAENIREEVLPAAECYICWKLFENLNENINYEYSKRHFENCTKYLEEEIVNSLRGVPNVEINSTICCSCYNSAEKLSLIDFQVEELLKELNKVIGSFTSEIKSSRGHKILHRESNPKLDNKSYAAGVQVTISVSKPLLKCEKKTSPTACRKSTRLNNISDRKKSPQKSQSVLVENVKTENIVTPFHDESSEQLYDDDSVQVKAEQEDIEESECDAGSDYFQSQTDDPSYADSNEESFAEYDDDNDEDYSDRKISKKSKAKVKKKPAKAKLILPQIDNKRRKAAIRAEKALKEEYGQNDKELEGEPEEDPEDKLSDYCRDDDEDDFEMDPPKKHKKKSHKKKKGSSPSRFSTPGEVFKWPFRLSNSACPICGKIFESTNAGGLQTHIMAHDSEVKFTCDICGAKFKTEYRYQSHKGKTCPVNVVAEGPCICEVCGKAYKNKHLLKSHHRAVHLNSERIFGCDQCPKKFLRKLSLTLHVGRTHTKELLQQCDICGKKLASKHRLNVHLRTHSGEKPHKCTECDKSYNDKDDLLAHVQTHTGKKFECETCGKKFGRKRLLNNHMRTHTGEKPYDCVVCSKKFSTSSALITHRKVHAEDKLGGSGRVPKVKHPSVASHHPSSSTHHPNITPMDLQSLPVRKPGHFVDNQDYSNFMDGFGLARSYHY